MRRVGHDIRDHCVGKALDAYQESRYLRLNLPQPQPQAIDVINVDLVAALLGLDQVALCIAGIGRERDTHAGGVGDGMRESSQESLTPSGDTLRMDRLDDAYLAARDWFRAAEPFDEPPGDDPVAYRYARALDLLDQAGLGSAQTLLRVLGGLPDIAIPYDVVLVPEVMVPSELFWGLTPSGLSGLVDGLERLALVNVSAIGGIAVLRLDPAVRAVVEVDLDACGQRLACVDLWCDLAYLSTAEEIAGLPDDPAADPVWDRLSPVLAAVFDLAVEWGDSGIPTSAVDQAANSALHAAEHFSSTGRPNDALDLARTVFEGCRRALGDTHERTLLAQAFLATFTGRAGDPRAAADLYAEVLASREAHFGADHVDTVAAREHLDIWRARSS